MLDDNERELWIEHPTLGAAADFVGLPIDIPDGIEINPYSLDPPELEIDIVPADQIIIAGFPFGASAGGLLAIWVSGTIASEPDVDYNGLPQFLVDCRSRQGMSGSPVFVYKTGSINRKYRGVALIRGSVINFLGIYSGRINNESDIGIVWKKTAIMELAKSIS